MATTVDLCSASIPHSDESGYYGSGESEHYELDEGEHRGSDDGDDYGSDEGEGHGSVESEEYGSDEREEYKSDEDSDGNAPIHSPAVRGLPVELWWNILEIANDGRALLATGCTCKTLRDIVREIIEKRTHMDRLDDILSDPTGGYFFSTARIRSAELPSCISTYHTKSQRLQSMEISHGRLLLRSQTRSALSQLKSVTTLTLEDIHFSTFSDFARTVCALPNLSTLILWRVTVDASRSYSLEGVYFARDLRLKELSINNCAFGESHPSWKLLTAPSLSDTLEDIRAGSLARDPQRALQELFIPPAALLSTSLGRLKRLQFAALGLSCSSEAVSRVTLSLLSRSPAGRVTAIEIAYACGHSPPCLHTLEALFTALDSGVAAVNFATLRTISVCLTTRHAFNADNIRIIVDSKSHSPEWTERFTMSSMVSTDNGINRSLSSDEQILETTEAAVEALPREVALEIRLTSFSLQLYPYRATVVYTRRSETVAL
ncbi:hypothetical protein CERSUDRAFT_107448 [Gelatoporia subvermispora B]|uniref:F-box domain-containing protein n=1 Tax=Ceriporiopsis subvermispora (strain B) TaxID=914234 RepID=M2QB19_CERS8|nr:hypothetical protein CERSUDRAFT_107448 [Gelatoporia subvermispora B]